MMSASVAICTDPCHESGVFKWLRRDPVAMKKKRIAALLEQARDAQRSGNIARYAELIAESEEVASELRRLEEAAAT